MTKWQTKKLGEIFDIARGGSPRPIRDYISDAPDAVNWITIKDASMSSKFIERTNQKIKPEGVQKSRLVKPNDFLLTNSMSFGRPYILKTTGCIHDGWLVLSDLTGEVDQDFFYHLLGSQLVYNQFSILAAGAVVKNLNIELVESVEVPFPPLPEQRRIAAILDKADAVRRKRQVAIKLTEEFLRSVFLDMFGDPVTNPKGWDLSPLGEISIVQGGLQVTSKRKSNPVEVPYLRVANVYRDRLALEEIKTIRVTRAELDRVALEKGDVLVVEGHGNREEIGRTAVWDGSIDKCVHQNHLIRVRFDEKVASPLYISSYLNSPGGRRQLFRFGKTTSGLNTISTSNVKNTEVLMPPLGKQKRFENVLVKTSQFKNLLCSSEREYRLIFDSLVQQAFAGGSLGKKKSGSPTK